MAKKSNRKNHHSDAPQELFESSSLNPELKRKEQQSLNEEQRRQVEEHYRSTLENMLEGCQIIGFDWRYLYLNDAVARQSRQSKEELLGHTMMEMYPGIEQTEMFAVLQNCMAKRLPHRMETEFSFPDGSQGWFELSIQPVPEGIFILSLDITERKRAERAFQVSNRFLEIANGHSDMDSLLTAFVTEVKQFTACSAVGIRILDEQGNISYHAYEGFNQAFYDLENPLSIQSDQCLCINGIKGETDAQLPFYTASGSFYINGSTRFLATILEEDKGKTRNRCHQFGYESVALIPIRFGNRILGLIHVADPKEKMVPLEVVEVMENINTQLATAIQRVQAEETLREERNRAQKYLDIAGVIFVVIDNDETVRLINQKGCEILGYQME
ncbi:PAS domain S-box protein [bacterium]|nr:PAS domain S-box protein [bacterium]